MPCCGANGEAAGKEALGCLLCRCSALLDVRGARAVPWRACDLAGRVLSVGVTAMLRGGARFGVSPRAPASAPGRGGVMAGGGGRESIVFGPLLLSPSFTADRPSAQGGRGQVRGKNPLRKRVRLRHLFPVSCVTPPDRQVWARQRSRATGLNHQPPASPRPWPGKADAASATPDRLAKERWGPGNSFPCLSCPRLNVDPA